MVALAILFYIAIGLAIVAVLGFLLHISIKLLYALIKFAFPYVKSFSTYVIFKFSDLFYHKRSPAFEDKENSDRIDIKEILNRADTVVTEPTTKSTISQESQTYQNNNQPFDQLLKEQEKKKQEEQEALLYAAMCEKHAKERDYLEAFGIDPDNYKDMK